MIRTADSVLLACCPPLPLDRNVSTLHSDKRISSDSDIGIKFKLFFLSYNFYYNKKGPFQRRALLTSFSQRRLLHPRDLSCYLLGLYQVASNPNATKPAKPC